MRNQVNFISTLKNIGFLFKDCCSFVKFYSIILFLGIHVVILETYFVGETGSRSRKQSMNRFRKWGRVTGFEGGWGGGARSKI